MSPDVKVSEISSGQAGLFLRSQAIDAGVAGSTIDLRIERGIWAVVHDGVLRAGTTPLTFFGAHMAAQLACRPRGRISHRSSAYFLDWLQRPEYPEVTVPYGKGPPRPAGVVVHRSRVYDRALEFSRGPLALTSPTDTLIDLAEVCSDAELKRALDCSIVTRSVHLDTLADRMESYKGRRGLKRLDVQVAMLPKGIENHDSVLETEFARLLQREGISGFVHHLGVETDMGTFEVDFAWPSAYLIVETDGKVHDFPDQKDFDRRRDEACERAGWRVKRFRWWDVTSRPSHTAEKVRRMLRRGVSDYPGIPG